MIHCFSKFGSTFVYDVESGGLYAPDDAGIAALREILCERGINCAELPDVSAPAADVAEAKLGWTALIETQGLFAPPLAIAPPREKPAIKAMCLNVAHACDLRCTYCFAHGGDYAGPTALMDLDVGMRALEFLVANSQNRRHLEVDFFGGEPLLCRETVKKIVAWGRALEQSHDKKISFTLTTNAYDVTDDDVAFLNEHIDNLVLSLDGRALVHDRVRRTAGGAGTHARVLENIQKLVNARGDKSHYIRGTFTRYNTDFTADVQAMLDAGLRNLSLEPVVSDPSLPWSLDEAAVARACTEYETLAQHYADAANSDDPYTFFHFVVEHEGGPCPAKRVSGCGAGVEYVAVAPDGSIWPCHQFVGLDGWRMGSVMDGRFDESVRTRLKARSIATVPACDGCFAKYHCAAGCAANAVLYGGDLYTPHGASCALQKARLECALSIQALLQ